MTSHVISKKLVAWDVNVQTVLQVLGAALFLGFCAQISIPLFFTPVPLSMTTFGIMLTGAILGSRKGLASVLSYLGMGCLGLPMFAQFSFGFSVLLGVKGGYLFGYLLLAYLSGWFVENYSKASMIKTFASFALFCFLEMSLGVLWLGNFVGWNQVLLMGFIPFVPGEILKSLAVAKYIAKNRR